MSTLQELRDITRDELKIDPNGQIWTNDDLDRWLNEGVTLFYAKANMKEEWADGTIDPLVDGQAAYTPETDFRKLLWAKLVDGDASSTSQDETMLTDVTNTLLEFQKGRDMDYEAETPGYIYCEGTSLYLYPVPNSDAVSRYTIKYKYSKRPAVLAAGDSPEVPTEWQFIFVQYAKYKAWSILPGKENEAQQALMLWEKDSQRAMADILWKGEYIEYRQPILPSKRRK